MIETGTFSGTIVCTCPACPHITKSFHSEIFKYKTDYQHPKWMGSQTSNPMTWFPYHTDIQIWNIIYVNNLGVWTFCLWKAPVLFHHSSRRKSCLFFCRQRFWRNHKLAANVNSTLAACRMVSQVESQLWLDLLDGVVKLLIVYQVLTTLQKKLEIWSLCFFNVECEVCWYGCKGRIFHL